MRLRELFDQELDELIGVKKYKDLTARQIMKKMEDELGLKRLGNGAFGDVVQSPDPNWVYKVLEKDPAYEEYIDFIAKNPNEHFPKIKRVKKMTSFFKRYRVQENKFLVVVIEKLEKIPEERIQFAIDLVNDDVDSIPTHTPDGGKNYSGFTLEELMSHDWDGWTSEDMWSTYYAARTIRQSELNRPHHSFMDLHRNNIMQRKDGTIVLIDPIASYEGLDYGSAISTARMAHDPMVKGPHYKPEPAQAGHGDDPYDTWDPHPPIDPGTTAWKNRPDATKPFPPKLPTDQLDPPWQGNPQKPLWSNADGNTKKAFDEWKALFYKTERTPEEERRFDKLNAYLDQKKKIKQPVGSPDLNFDKTNSHQWSDRPQSRGVTDKAFDELEDLAAITQPNARQVARMNYLQRVIDQQLEKHNQSKHKVKTKKPINSTAEAKAEFDRIMNQTRKSTADLDRAHELNAYLEKEYNRELGSS